MNVRVRFAPSPTGYLHVGSARTALSNWIYARSVGGAFVLRIEDTDADRSRPELIDQILRTLEWLGLDWDEGPIRQSGRVERYDHAVDTLLRAGWAFHDEGAVRFRTPDEGVTGWDDVIRGRVEFDNVNLEDFVIRRSNGAATFLLANAVDDLDMGITHAIRGEDLVNTTPKVLLLMHALEAAAPPVYAHLPLLVNERRQKLSKRRDDVAVEDYRDRGYLPEAMANYLATLGWGAPDGVEVRPMAEIVSLFRLEDMNKASAFF
ncbi:MAG: glutamate--tRNA ligase, partial [Acidimicrobiales bacterium]